MARVTPEAGTSVPVALLLLEEYDLDTGVLRAPNSIVEYNVLVWNDNDELVFQKSGKVGRKNLEKALSFNAQYGLQHTVSLELSVTINNQITKFVTLSPYSDTSRLLSDNLSYTSPYFVPVVGDVMEFPVKVDVGVKDAVDPGITTTTTIDPAVVAAENSEPAGADSAQIAELRSHIFAEWNAGGHLDIPLFLVEQEAANTYILDNLGASAPDVPKTIETIKTSELELKQLEFRLKLLKKESLGATSYFEQEIAVLDSINNEALYDNLATVLAFYNTNGVENVSEYRQGMYNYFKQAYEALVVIKGKLENLNIKVKAKAKQAVTPEA